MPEMQLSPNAGLFYREDDLTDPWRQPEAAFLLHGFAESGLAWNAWMPHFARRFRVVRPDMRGFGQSTPMPVDYPWSVDEIISDFLKLADRLGIERFHVVGAKFAAGLAFRIAASHPERVRTVTVTGARIISGQQELRGRSDEVRAQFEREGVEGYARRTNLDRLGSDCSPEKTEGWIKMMAAETPLSSAIGFVGSMPGSDASVDLPRIVCPTLVIITQSSMVGVEGARARQELIPRSELLVLEGTANHVAAAHPDLCARAALDFIDRVGGTA
jgi:3-oxoadipate enol-lactonase